MRDSPKLNNNIVDITKNCYVCNEVVTRKNYFDGLYLCNDCKKMTHEELYSKLIEVTREIMIDDPIFENNEVFKALIKKDDNKQ